MTTYKWAKYNKNVVTNTRIIHAEPEHYTAYLDEYYDNVSYDQTFTFYANENDFKNGKTTTLEGRAVNRISEMIASTDGEYKKQYDGGRYGYWAYGVRDVENGPPYYYMEHEVSGSKGKYFSIGYELKEEKTTSIERGSYISDVTSTNRNAYPDNNYSGSYWYVYKGIDNQSPTISGSNLDLGDKVEDFNIEYVISDADGDNCTVDITVDNVKRVTAKSVTLNTRYTYPIKIDDFTLGRHTVTIVAKDSKGATSPTRTYTFTKSNTAPTISGTDTDLGGKSTAFTETYRVTDKNSEDVKVTVILDDTEIATVSSAQDKDLSFTITDEQLLSFEIGSTHTITIKADDGKGGVAYRRYTFTKINRPPIISGSDGDLGAKKETFTQKFSFTDVEKDKIYSRVYLDGKQVLENLEVEDGKEYSYSISHDDFIRLKYGKHEIKIEAWDDYSENSKVYRIYTFEKVLNGLEVEIKINEFDVQPTKVIGVPHGIFASDAEIKVFACNNYLDDKPTWEDMSTESKAARAYAFKNSTKTADKWAIGIKIIAENGESDVSSVLRGVKGGYE